MLVAVSFLLDQEEVISTQIVEQLWEMVVLI